MKTIRTTANKYLVYRDELLALANSAEHKGTAREDALLAGHSMLEVIGNIHDNPELLEVDNG